MLKFTACIVSRKTRMKDKQKVSVKRKFGGICRGISQSTFISNYAIKHQITGKYSRKKIYFLGRSS